MEKEDLMIINKGLEDEMVSSSARTFESIRSYNAF